MDQPQAHTIAALLSAPFPADEVQWKPGAVSGNRALAMAYIDARSVQDRLDAVLGIDGWQDEYQVLPEGSVVCKLHLRIDGEWITKTDVGSESDQPDGGDRKKAAFSDALKRAAVKFGVGRYLYSLPTAWVDYDAKKRVIVSPPRLPSWALPGEPKHAPKVAASAAEEEAAEHNLEPLATRPPDVLVSDEEAKELKAAMQVNKVDHKLLFEEYQIGRLSELPAHHLDDAYRKVRGKWKGTKGAKAETAATS